MAQGLLMWHLLNCEILLIFLCSLSFAIDWLLKLKADNVSSQFEPNAD